jgi:Flp pilus assembly protein CpaB
VKRSNRLVIFVGVLLAILAFVGIIIVLNGSGGVGSSNATPPPRTSVLVAKVDIAIGDPVTPDKVEVQQVDPADVVGSALGAASQVSGQPALYPIPAGSQVSKEAIGLGTAGNFCISCQLKPGEKAIAFQVDRVTGLDFLIQPGDHVDVVLSQSITVLQPTTDTVSKPANQQRFETIPGLNGVRTVKAILQDKRVLYVSQTRVQQNTGAQASASPSAGGQAQAAAPAIENVIIVIAGTDQDAEVIKFAQDNVSEVGPLTAILRNATDTNLEQTTGITIDQLVSKYGLRIPNIVQRLSSPAP